MKEKYKVGDKIYFAEEKKPYTIRACDERFLICTKPHNFKPNTVIYTIVDLKEKIRGTDNYSIGWCDYYETEDCERMLQELQEASGEVKEEIINGVRIVNEPFMGTYISHRNRVDLNIVNR